MSGPDGGVDGGVAVFVLGVDVGAVGDQELHDRIKPLKIKKKLVCFSSFVSYNNNWALTIPVLGRIAELVKLLHKAYNEVLNTRVEF